MLEGGVVEAWDVCVRMLVCCDTDSKMNDYEPLLDFTEMQIFFK